MAQTQPDPFAVTITVDANETIGPLKPIWRFFGADEPNYATLPHGRELLGHLGDIGPKSTYFRAHNLLTTGDGTPDLKWGSTNAYTEDANGNPVYDWTILDNIFDAYLANGVRPYVQIGFMPEALSIQPQPYQHRWTPTAKYEEIYTGWAYPPEDYDQWGELVYQWAKHCVDRYGKEEVETWYWETWNEPNIGYWQGTHEEFCKLHDVAIAAVKRALPTAKVGGPDVAGHGGEFMTKFLEHVLTGTNHATGKVGTPMDFVSFHAKGSPRFIKGDVGDGGGGGGGGHVQMGIAAQLKTIDRGFELIASYPELKDKPIIIGESDPEGCAACQGPQLGYRNGTMYSSYTAASFARKHELADRHGVNLEGALTWAFEFEDQPYFAGQRVLATNGLDLPVLNVFRMYGKMVGDDVADAQRLKTISTGAVSVDEMMESGVRGQPDVAAFAGKAGNRVSVMVWHYHDDDLPGPDAAVTLKLSNLEPGRVMITEYRIDRDHSNAYAVWQAMGSPQSPTAEQYARLDAAGQLATTGEPRTAATGPDLTLNFTLPRQGVSLFVIERP